MSDQALYPQRHFMRRLAQIELAFSAIMPTIEGVRRSVARYKDEKLYEQMDEDKRTALAQSVEDTLTLLHNSLKPVLELARHMVVNHEVFQNVVLYMDPSAIEEFKREAGETDSVSSETDNTSGGKDKVSPSRGFLNPFKGLRRPPEGELE